MKLDEVTNETKSLLPILRDWQKNDRKLFDLANRAFVSHIQSYSKHECQYVLRLKYLPMGELATYFGLMRMPKMPELKKIKIVGFKSVKVDFNSIKYKNKEKEESRQGKLAEYKKTGIWPGMKSKPAEKIAWSNKVDQKERREDRKRIKDLKEASNSKNDDLEDDDDDDLDEDYRLLKKMRKKNSAAKDNFDRNIDLENVEDDE